MSIVAYEEETLIQKASVDYLITLPSKGIVFGLACLSMSLYVSTPSLREPTLIKVQDTQTSDRPLVGMTPTHFLI